MPRRRSKTAAITCRAAETAKQCVQLRIEGHSFPAIAERVGCSTSTAHKHVSEWLKKAREETALDATEVLQIELDRLDELLVGLWPAARAGDCASVDRALRVMERRAKLLGLDAPDRHRLEAAKADDAAEHMDTDEARAILAARIKALSDEDLEAASNGDPNALAKLDIKTGPQIYLPPLSDD